LKNFLKKWIGMPIFLIVTLPIVSMVALMDMSTNNKGYIQNVKDVYGTGVNKNEN